MTTPPRPTTPPPGGAFGPPPGGPYTPPPRQPSNGSNPYRTPPSGGQQPRYTATAGGGRGETLNGGNTTNRTTNRTKSRHYNLNINKGGGNNGGGSGGGGGAGQAASGADRHQGDSMIHRIERIEITSDKDVIALGKAINHLGRELHLILGMRAEELQAVLGQYKGRWYTFGAGSKVKARLVAAHLKVAAEAAKAIGVGALKMSHAFQRHFIAPEQEARRRANGAKGRKAFTIGED